MFGLVCIIYIHHQMVISRSIWCGVNDGNEFGNISTCIMNWRFVPNCKDGIGCLPPNYNWKLNNTEMHNRNKWWHILNMTRKEMWKSSSNRSTVVCSPMRRRTTVNTSWHSMTFHPWSSVDSISKETVARHPLSHHTCDNWSCVYAYPDLQTYGREAMSNYSNNYKHVCCTFTVIVTYIRQRY